MIKHTSELPPLASFGLLGDSICVLPVVSGFPQQDGHTLRWWTLPASL